MQLHKQLTLTKCSTSYLFSEKMSQLKKLDFSKILENAQKEGLETLFSTSCSDVNFQFFDKVELFIYLLSILFYSGIGMLFSQLGSCLWLFLKEAREIE